MKLKEIIDVLYGLKKEFARLEVAEKEKKSELKNEQVLLQFQQFQQLISQALDAISNTNNNNQDAIPVIIRNCLSKLSETETEDNQISVLLNKFEKNGNNIVLQVDDLQSEIYKTPTSFVEHVTHFKNKIELNPKNLDRFTKDNRLFDNLYSPEKYLNPLLEQVNKAINRIAINPKSFDKEMAIIEKILYQQIYNDLFENNEIKKELVEIFSNIDINKYINSLIINYNLYLNMVLTENIRSNSNSKNSITIGKTDLPIIGHITSDLEKRCKKLNNISNAESLEKLIEQNEFRRGHRLKAEQIYYANIGIFENNKDMELQLIIYQTEENSKTELGRVYKDNDGKIYALYYPAKDTKDNKNTDDKYDTHLPHLKDVVKVVDTALKNEGIEPTKKLFTIYQNNEYYGYNAQHFVQATLCDNILRIDDSDYTRYDTSTIKDAIPNGGIVVKKRGWQPHENYDWQSGYYAIKATRREIEGPRKNLVSATLISEPQEHYINGVSSIKKVKAKEILIPKIDKVKNVNIDELGEGDLDEIIDRRNKENDKVGIDLNDLKSWLNTSIDHIESIRGRIPTGLKKIKQIIKKDNLTGNDFLEIREIANNRLNMRFKPATRLKETALVYQAITSITTTNKFAYAVREDSILANQNPRDALCLKAHNISYDERSTVQVALREIRKAVDIVKSKKFFTPTGVRKIEKQLKLAEKNGANLSHLYNICRIAKERLAIPSNRTKETRDFYEVVVNEVGVAKFPNLFKIYKPVIEKKRPEINQQQLSIDIIDDFEIIEKGEDNDNFATDGFEMKSRLGPIQVYHANVGIFENDKDMKLMLTIFEESKNGENGPEMGRVYANQDGKQYIVYYPGRDNDKTYKDDTPSLRRVIQVVDDGVKEYNERITWHDYKIKPTKQLFTICESNTYMGFDTSHFVQATLSGGKLTIDDSMNRDYKIDQIEQLFPNNEVEVKPRGWQSRWDDKHCGYYTIAATERAIYDRTTTEFEINESVIKDQHKLYLEGIKPSKTKFSETIIVKNPTVSLSNNSFSLYSQSGKNNGQSNFPHSGSFIFINK